MTTRNFEKFPHTPRNLKQCTCISLCACPGNTWKNRKPHTSLAYVEVLRSCVSRKWKLKCIVNFLKIKAYIPTQPFFFWWGGQKVKEIKVGYFRKPSDQSLILRIWFGIYFDQPLTKLYWPWVDSRKLA